MIKPVDLEISGYVEPGFEAVRQQFVENFTSRGEVGASLCIFRDGSPIVDLVAGVDTTGAPYSPETLQLVFSTTKGAAAICAHLLVQDGLLDLSVPVVEYWPEFGDYGKDSIPAGWLLCHKSGLIDTSMPLTLAEALDWDTVTAALAASKPRWTPGERHGYHAVTYGWLVGELVRRVSGIDFGTFLQTRVAVPLGLDLWVGLPENQHHRVSKVIPMGVPEGFRQDMIPTGRSSDDTNQTSRPGFLALLEKFLGPDNLIGPALSAPGGAFTDQNLWNDPNVWSAQIPAANGVTNAASLARMYAATIGEVDGVRLLEPPTLDRATQVQTDGPDAVLMMPIPFALGFMRHSQFSGFSSPSAFGHYGAGGSVGFADPSKGISFGYVMNKMQLSLAGDQRTGALISALNESLG